MHGATMKMAFELFTVVWEVKKLHPLRNSLLFTVFFNIMKSVSQFYNNEIFKNILITVGLYMMDFQRLLSVKLNTKISHKPPQ